MYSLRIVYVSMAYLASAHCLSSPKGQMSMPTKPASPATSEQQGLSRRQALVTGTTAVTVAAVSLLNPSPSSASPGNIPTIEGPPERRALLQAIADEASDDVMVDLLAKLQPLDPSRGKGASVAELDGTWELIYSINAEAFSPLLILPAPIRPTSLQLLGAEAARQVGEGRVAQVLNFPNIPLSFLLSSGAVPVQENPSTLEIFPPFRFELVWGDKSLRSPKPLPISGSRITVVEAGSDADFRAINARDEDAQAAGRNMYKQRYLEVTGQPGDLRISEVVSGDPVIIGAVFVHRRL